jgi:hypothetical protein
MLTQFAAQEINWLKGDGFLVADTLVLNYHAKF